VAQALRALERARDRTGAAAAAERSAPLQRLIAACEAAERALIELGEVGAAVDAAAAAFDFEPDRLERAEARLFALRAMARRLEIGVGALGAARARIAQRLMAIENAESELAVAQAAATAARAAYATAAAAVTLLRRAAGARLEASVKGELGPLKLDKAAFRVVVEPEVGGRAGPQGVDRVEFEIATLPGAPFAPLGAIASGGELARFALAIKASLAARAVGAQPVMIFDEVDQGVGGAVADAVGVRLKRLATQAQVLVVTHSPQVAARADAHWRVDRLGDGGNVRAEVEVLSPSTREEEIARMLSGARVSDAARAAARALMHA
jgi:DNA repair protein RecN (Recombination protein N)